MKVTSSFHLIPPIFKSLLNGIIDLIYPPLCLVCEQRLDPGETDICQSCLAAFNLLGHPHKSFSVPGEIHIDTAWPLFDFDAPLQKVIHHLKYSRRRKPIITILNHYAENILSQLPKQGIDYIISIPLHPTKYRERGYNQVDDISDWLAEKLGAEVGRQFVRRNRYTETQTKLSAEERQQNVKDAFSVSGETLRDSHVLLVDDVLTTGATANSLAMVLRQAGVKKIDLVTLSTPQHGNA